MGRFQVRWRTAAKGLGGALAALLLAGCSAHVKGDAEVLRKGSENGDDGGASTASAPAPSGIFDRMKQAVGLLEREGLIPVNVEVYLPNEDPATGFQIEALDASFTKYSAAMGEDGKAHLSLPTLHITRWRVNAGTGWIAVPPPQLTPEKSGYGLRGVILLPPIPPMAPSTAAPAVEPTPTVAHAVEDGGSEPAASGGLAAGEGSGEARPVFVSTTGPPVASPPAEPTAWLNPGGDAWHDRADCPYVRTDAVRVPMSIAVAERRPCRTCGPGGRLYVGGGR